QSPDRLRNGWKLRRAARQRTSLTRWWDWLSVKPDGSITLDVRAVLETDDGELIYTFYPGRMILTPEMFAMDRSERTEVDPANYYFRTLPTYETGSEKYGWLNNIVAVGVGRITEKGVGFSVYEVK
ncbi:MAG: DUF3237 domain-containing protein, partial [Alphaproteobacteria bacterium]|nr:DUF3237 domain-containing protein [Alphaproteobacteria bacterium]